VATDIAIFFCDPHSPWQRGTNENNGLLRQYFTKVTDLSVYTADYLDTVAAELNDRPRRLEFAKPIEKIGPLLLRCPPGSADRPTDGQTCTSDGAQRGSGPGKLWASSSGPAGQLGRKGMKDMHCMC